MCKEMIKDKVMGAFLTSLHKHRDSDAFKVQDCFKENEKDVEKSLECYRTYMRDIDTSNQRIVDEFALNYPNYV